jgi:hypothetical protein
MCRPARAGAAAAHPRRPRGAEPGRRLRAANPHSHGQEHPHAAVCADRLPTVGHVVPSTPCREFAVPVFLSPAPAAGARLRADSTEPTLAPHAGRFCPARSARPQTSIVGYDIVAGATTSSRGPPPMSCKPLSCPCLPCPAPPRLDPYTIPLCVCALPFPMPSAPFYGVCTPKFAAPQPARRGPAPAAVAGRGRARRLAALYHDIPPDDLKLDFSFRTRGTAGCRCRPLPRGGPRGIDISRLEFILLASALFSYAQRPQRL